MNSVFVCVWISAVVLWDVFIAGKSCNKRPAEADKRYRDIRRTSDQQGEEEKI